MKIIIASGPVIVEDNKVLLNQHGDTEFWKFCGGKIEDYDTDLIDNARREAKEEMGIDIKITNGTPFFLYTKKETAEAMPDGRQGKIDVILVHFLAERIGEIKPGEDIRKWKWIPLDELEKENLAPNIFLTLKHFGFLI